MIQDTLIGLCHRRKMKELRVVQAFPGVQKLGSDDIGTSSGEDPLFAYSLDISAWPPGRTDYGHIDRIRLVVFSDSFWHFVKLSLGQWYPVLYFLFVLLLPINAPAEYWGENIYASIFIAGWFTYAVQLQLAWLIHSATRIWGLRPGENVLLDFEIDSSIDFLHKRQFQPFPNTARKKSQRLETISVSLGVLQG
ncbi:hypothetical protein NQ318_009715 [Aromia moschata]|uniref:Uncharacterized protein n=1 Tax=Aromia moschata TaxID=1265417 RepID=A0AAV8X2F2_9CUCU|nr:hypothetical protein NQ318_009715 [Aromia moschata]